MSTVDLRCGNVLDVLKTLADESVNCVVTSPPYYGLRAYGTEPQIWMNGHEPCAEHQWQNAGGGLLHENRNNLRGSQENVAGQTGVAHIKKYDHKETNTCSICGAWRGELGLEPTPELYVDHLVQIFREARRVLRNDGVLFLNLGDSYWGGKGRSGYELPHEAEARRAKGETLQTAHNIPGYVDMRPTDGKHPAIKPKDLIGIPWMVAFALRNDGWYLRQDIIWAKPNPMPESVRDRCTKAHEYIFLITKSAKYYFDSDAILEPANYDGRKDTMMKGAKKYPNGFVPPDVNPNSLHVKGHERWSRKLNQQSLSRQSTAGGRDRDTGEYLGRVVAGGIPARNKRSVWAVATRPFREAHFATFPEKLIEPMILAGCPVGGMILDPFSGAGTTGVVAVQHGLNYIGIDLNPEYTVMAQKRIEQVQMSMVLE